MKFLVAVAIATYIGSKVSQARSGGPANLWSVYIIRLLFAYTVGVWNPA